MTTQFILPPLWAILPTQTGRILDIYEKQLEFYSNRPDIKENVIPTTTMNYGGKEYKFNVLEDNKALQGVPATFDIKDGVAILPIEGVIIPKSDFFTLFFGGFAALDILTRDFRELVGREDVHTIILDIDSPGGNAFGVQQFANIVFEARSEKNIISITSGMMASAAMWIGAAASKVFITGDVTVVGSIGTVTTHTDISELNKKIGITQTEVAAGEFKRVPSMLQPLDEKGRAVLQEQVNQANSAFINDIAKFKNIKPGAVNKMAEGRTFIGIKGIEVGLIDGKKSMDSFFATDDDIKAMVDNFNSNFNILIGGNSMTLLEQIAEMKKNNVDLYDAIIKEGKVQAQAEFEKNLPEVKTEEYNKGVEAGKVEGKEEGVKAERDRISSIRELATAGNKDLIEKFIADGKTTAPEAAIEILKAQKASKKTDLDNLEKDSPDAIDADVNNDLDSTDDKDKKLSQLVEEYMADHKCSKGVAIAACSKKYPNAENDFIKEVKRKR